MKTRLLILLPLLLCACQSFKWTDYIADQNKQYVAAKAAPPLKIPSNLDNASLQDQQILIPALPASNNPVVTEEPNLLPPGSMAAEIKAGTLPPSVLKTKLPDPE